VESAHATVRRAHEWRGECTRPTVRRAHAWRGECTRPTVRGVHEWRGECTRHGERSARVAWRVHTPHGERSARMAWRAQAQSEPWTLTPTCSRRCRCSRSAAACAAAASHVPPAVEVAAPAACSEPSEPVAARALAVRRRMHAWRSSIIESTHARHGWLCSGYERVMITATPTRAAATACNECHACTHTDADDHRAVGAVACARGGRVRCVRCWMLGHDVGS
jgi:hypothetical protein